MHLPSATAWLIIIVLALLIFAGPRLPKMARGLGESMRVFKSEMKQMKDDDKPATGADASTPTTPTSPSAGAEQTPLTGRVVEDDAKHGPRA